MFQYIILCKNRNKILLPDDRENLKLIQNKSQS